MGNCGTKFAPVTIIIKKKKNKQFYSIVNSDTKSIPVTIIMST